MVLTLVEANRAGSNFGNTGRQELCRHVFGKKTMTFDWKALACRSGPAGPDACKPRPVLAGEPRRVRGCRQSIQLSGAYATRQTS